MMEFVALGKTGEFVLSFNQNPYEEVLQDFKNASLINIATFNISTKSDVLISALKNINNGCRVEIITNIPQRYDKYFSEEARYRGQRMVEQYTKILHPNSFPAIKCIL